jgi:hypothetical protein
VSLGRSGNLGDREVWKDWHCGRFGKMFSQVINVFLELHVDCICSISVDYRTERLVRNITGVQIHSNVFMMGCGELGGRNVWEVTKAVKLRRSRGVRG